MDLQSLLDFSTFANYGVDVNKEIEGEMFLNLLTPLGSVKYMRDMGTDAKKSLSRAINPALYLKLSNQVINSLQNYNNNADDGTERRVAVPADSVQILQSNTAQGELDVQLRYYRLRDLQILDLKV